MLLFFVVDGQIVKYRTNISPKIIQKHSQSNFNIRNIEKPAAIARLLELGWYMIGCRQVDNSQMEFHVVTKFAMIRVWFLVHPTDQVIIKMSITAYTFQEVLSADCDYDIWKKSSPTCSNKQFRKWLKTMKEYVQMSGTIGHISHSFQKEPDVSLADLLHKCLLYLSHSRSSGAITLLSFILSRRMRPRAGKSFLSKN